MILLALLNTLKSQVDLVPAFVGAASSPNVSFEWKGAYFYNTTAWMEFHNNKAHSWTCMDLYVFATPYRVTWDYYFLSWEHTFEFKEWEGKTELEYEGISIFLMEAGMLGVYPLFTNTGWGAENSNIGFLKKQMGVSFEERPQPWVTNITVDDIQSRDFLAISKIRGRLGGFQTFDKWVTGAYAGHAAVCFRDSEGKLWVGESGHVNEEFNETAAWEYALSMKRKPYGYHNFIFNWIDTLVENYPPPLDANL
ncbi:hypothetical protein RJ641_034591, partial [Dillenia turbinata]